MIKAPRMPDIAPDAPIHGKSEKKGGIVNRWAMFAAMPAAR